LNNARARCLRAVGFLPSRLCYSFQERIVNWQEILSEFPQELAGGLSHWQESVEEHGGDTLYHAAPASLLGVGIRGAVASRAGGEAEGVGGGRR
jgi:hypothetical protein